MLSSNVLALALTLGLRRPARRHATV